MKLYYDPITVNCRKIGAGLDRIGAEYEEERLDYVAGDHKLPANTFFETVQLARRWTGPTALEAGIVQQIASAENLLDVARARAEELSPLAANRRVFSAQKESLYGENAASNGVHGQAHLLRDAAPYAHSP